MKAIFIGIDGCLNHQNDDSRNWSEAERFGLAPDLVANLKTVLDAVPDAKLVISSAWRADHDNRGLDCVDGDWHYALGWMLGIDGAGRMDDAPTLHEFGPPNVNGAKGRAHDILLWVSEHGGGDPFVVIDDECKELRKWLGGHVVDCAYDAPRGFTADRAQQAIAVLKAGHAVERPPAQARCTGGC